MSDGPRRLRVAVGGIVHETNTFIPRPTTLATLRAADWLAGERLVAAYRGTGTELGGMLAAAERLGLEAVPAVYVAAEPGGLVSAEAYAAAAGALLDALAAAGPLDAVCLALHGAGVADGVDDLEGDLLARVREQVGPSVPVLATLDLHTNLTAAMVAHATALVPCLRYPHVDFEACGERAVELAAGCARGELRPVTAARSVPLLTPPTATDGGVGAELRAAAEAWRERPGVLHAAYLHGFPFTDVPAVGAAALVVADGDAALAEQGADALADELWRRRERLPVERPDAAAAVAAALRAVATGENGRPVVLAEVSDNPGGGAPGDGTRLLRAMVAAELPDACFGFLCDEAAAAAAHAAGEGARIALRLGGASGPAAGEPLAVEAEVVRLTDGRFRALHPMERGRQVDLGPSALLRIGTVEVIVASGRTQTLDEAIFALHGVDVARRAVVALKSSAHYRAWFAPRASAVIEADTGGATSAAVERLGHRRLRRPVWPLDPDAPPTRPLA
ncbi:microcystin degradation protein MlrC [Conexibacter arvalis]|uniref:Microcystin degradation protein MlrC n=2 Tax=Conexibacter arvalis TaxID=912552 RepID=A0A840ILK5_9ACTN|nr:M81 family metallopeptidase [Conexibacter arvalis]MBB4665131.1 microcystin degradation protein MlrC [Conexibacter arvalis]